MAGVDSDAQCNNDPPGPRDLGLLPPSAPRPSAATERQTTVIWRGDVAVRSSIWDPLLRGSLPSLAASSRLACPMALPATAASLPLPEPLRRDATYSGYSGLKCSVLLQMSAPGLVLFLGQSRRIQGSSNGVKPIPLLRVQV
jgi:hypothetical protein